MFSSTVTTMIAIVKPVKLMKSQNCSPPLWALDSGKPEVDANLESNLKAMP